MATSDATSGASAAVALAPVIEITPAAPVGQAERITALDSLRGFALLGILLMNIVGMGMYANAYDDPTVTGGSTGANLWVWIVMHVLAEGKMRCLFSMVFGASVVLLTSRLEGRRDAADIYYRRTLWLLLFGILHAFLLWVGDILYPYALCALLLYPFRNLKARTLLLIGSVVLICTGGSYLAYTYSAKDKIEQGRAAEAASKAGKKLTEKQQAAKEEYEQSRKFSHPDAEALKKDAEQWRGNPLQVIQARSKIVSHYHAAPYYSPWNWDVWSMMFIGMGLFKLGVLSGAKSQRFYAALVLIGYGIGIPLNSYTAWLIVRSNFDPVVAGFTAPTYDIGRLSIAMGHLGVIMLLAKSGSLAPLMARLGALGQMALSNYVFQSVVAAFIFTGYGFRMYGRLQRYQLYYVVAAIWAFQLVVSPIWLRHFRFGPLEWAWRSLTYWKRQPMRLALYAIALLIAGAGAATAQHDPAGPVEKPVALLTGLGTWTHPIATRNPQAQRFFDQGLVLLYGFNRYEALRSFRKAAELDPGAAMPWWGIAMAQGPQINMDIDGDVNMPKYCEAVATGLRLEHAPPIERDWLEAANRRCPEERGSAYIDAMRALCGRYPDDPDARTLFAESLMVPVRWRWYGRDGVAAPGVVEAERALEDVMRRFPDHPGANHFYIHVVESSPTPERAVPSAQRLMGIVPAAGHLVHMPGHIWMRLGDYQTVADVNERAAELDRRYMSQTGVVASPVAGYYAHNLQFLLAARWMQGYASKALQAGDQLQSAVESMVGVMGDFVDPYLSVKLMTQLRFGQWDAVLAAPQPDSKFLVNGAMYRYARAVALAHRGDAARSTEEQQAFETARAKVPADRAWGLNKASDVLAMVSEIVAARVAKSPVVSVPHWKRAVELEDSLAYDEPPPWYYPVRESLGAALLRANRADEAEAVFREGERRTPRDGRMLFGLMESLKAQGKTSECEWVRREFNAAWRGADVKLRIEDL